MESDGDFLTYAKAWCFDMGFSLISESTKCYDDPFSYTIWSEYDPDGNDGGYQVLDGWYSDKNEAILIAWKNKEQIEKRFK
jgi:hypothetical protein